MSTKPSPRVLAIAPASRKFGFVVLKERFDLIDWGVKNIPGDWNTQSLSKVVELIERYSPHLIALPDVSGGHRSPNTLQLMANVVSFCQERALACQLIRKEDMAEHFFGRERVTKHELAVHMATIFGEGLAERLPPKRKAWESEHYSMSLFVAAALALTGRHKQYGFIAKKRKRSAEISKS